MDETLRTKACKTCGLEKPATEFYVAKSSNPKIKPQLFSRCKPCERVHARQRYYAQKAARAEARA